MKDKTFSELRQEFNKIHRKIQRSDDSLPAEELFPLLAKRAALAVELDSRQQNPEKFTNGVYEKAS